MVIAQGRERSIYIWDVRRRPQSNKSHTCYRRSPEIWEFLAASWVAGTLGGGFSAHALSARAEVSLGEEWVKVLRYTAEPQGALRDSIGFS
jgi:hypothetical protein